MYIFEIRYDKSCLLKLLYNNKKSNRGALISELVLII